MGRGKEMTNFNINKNGFWSGITADTDKHAHDVPLANAIISFFKSKNVNTVVDFGAGLGKYTKSFREAGITTDCYDGNPDTVALTEGRCSILDLSQDFTLPKHDWVMSLEVG